MDCTQPVTPPCWPVCWLRDARGCEVASTSTSRRAPSHTKFWRRLGTSKFLPGVDVARKRRQGLADAVRSSARRWAKPADEWRAKVQRWVDAGIVSSSQGDQILAMETLESSGHALRGAANRPVLSPVVEAVSYFGVVVVGLSRALFDHGSV